MATLATLPFNHYQVASLGGRHLCGAGTSAFPMRDGLQVHHHVRPIDRALDMKRAVERPVVEMRKYFLKF